MSPQSRRKQDKSFPKVKSNSKRDVTDLLGETGQEKPPSNTLPLEQIVLSNSQPRRYFDQDKLAQLAESIKEHGILENLLVRPSPTEKGKYELVSGERRLRAAQQAGLKEVPVQIYEFGDEEVLEIALIENLQREDLNPVDEAEGILRLLSHRLKRDEHDISKQLVTLLQQHKRGQTSSHNVMGQEELAILEQVFEQLGRMSWQSFTSNRLPLLRLPGDILKALRKGQIEYTKAKVIAKLKNAEQRKDLLNRAIEEDLSIRAIREQVKQIQQESNSSAETKTVEAPKRIDNLTKQIKKKKPWQHSPEQWQQIETYLQKIEQLLEQEN